MARWLAPDTTRDRWRLIAGLSLGLAGMLVLSGCPKPSTPGSGTSGGVALVPAFTIPDVPITALATTFVTAEFQVNGGLSQVNAQHAYARGGTGTGVTVAVIDTGIDATHTELDGNIAAGAVDIVSPSTPIADSNGHGTAVAGVIAAEKNGIATHGLAFNATLLPIRADEICGTPPCGFTDPDIAAAIDYAISNGADVINLSLAGPASTSVLQDAINRAAAAGVIVVAAAGNDSLSAPEFPAAYAGSTGAAGLVLAVGAVTDLNTLASFSNRCGGSGTEAFCLVAPGVSIETTLTGGGSTSVSGTSFSAPHVAAAVAVLLELYPSLSPAQVVQIILQTAQSLGGATIFGHGLLDLQNAVTPQGIAAVPLSSGTGGFPDGDGELNIALADSSIVLGTAFGDALAGASPLNDAIFLDRFGRPFKIDLAGRVARAARTLGLEHAIAHERYRTVPLPGLAGLAMTLGFTENDFSGVDTVDGARGYSAAEARFDASDFNAVVDLPGSARLAFAIDASPARVSAGGGGPVPERLFRGSAEMFAPTAMLLPAGTGIGFSHRLDDRTGLSMGFMAREGSDRARLWTARLDRRIGDNASLGVSYSVTDEHNGLLGSEVAGAFGDVRAVSQMLTADARVSLGGGLSAFGGFTHGWTRVDEEGPGLIGDWGEIRSTAFGAGLDMEDALIAGDRLGLLVGQPLRVDKARATLTVPVAMERDGTIVWQTSRSDIAPRGRELDFQLAYDYAFGDGSKLAGWMMTRLDPGHVAGASPEFGVGLRLRLGL